jgi:hypothetical protein
MYTRHTARFLLLWLLVVPMSLYHEFRKTQSWNLIFLVPIISFFNATFLFGIEELGVQIEEPFSILPLASISNEIQNTGVDILSDCGVYWFAGETDPTEQTDAANKQGTAVSPEGSSNGNNGNNSNARTSVSAEKPTITATAAMAVAAAAASPPTLSTEVSLNQIQPPVIVGNNGAIESILSSSSSSSPAVAISELAAAVAVAGVNGTDPSAALLKV